MLRLPDLTVEQHGIVFVFGARPLIQTGELREHFKGTAILGCSTSGEIVGDTVVDDWVIATAVEFEHTRLRTVSAKIGEAKSSYEVGPELARPASHGLPTTSIAVHVPFAVAS